MSPDERSQNRLRNRFILPEKPGDVNAEIKIEDLLGSTSTKPTDKVRATSAAKVSGYVQEVRDGGPEIANCQTNDQEDWNTVILLSKDPVATPEQCILAVVTPRMRKLIKGSAPDWNTSNLKLTLVKGSKIEVTGWLFFDQTTLKNSANNPNHMNDVWRGTAWEIHPVTDLRFIKGPS
jgi:hypothetical protein